MNSRKRLFFSNIVIFGFTKGAEKVFPLFMLPIITRMIPNSSVMGIFDVFSVFLNILTQVALLGMYDALFTVAFDLKKMEDRKNVFSSALFSTSLFSIVLFVFLKLFSKNLSFKLFNTNEYGSVFILIGFAVFLSTTGTVFNTPIRMENRRKLYVLIRLINPIVYYSVAILFLINKNFIFALPVARTASLMFILIVSSLFTWRWFNPLKIKKEKIVELFKIGFPLMPSLIVYSLFNSIDRLMINSFLGIGAVGIYSIGAKMASVSQIFQTAFAGGYQYFAFYIKDDEDNEEVVITILKGLTILTVTVFFLAWILAKPLFKLLYTGDFINGYIVFPYLSITPLILIMFHTIRNQLLIHKKSVIISIILLLGALANIGLNMFLIPRLGIEGAGIASFITYLITFFLLYFYANKKNILSINIKIINAVLMLFILPIAKMITRNYFEKYEKMYLIIFLILEIIIFLPEIRKIITRKKFKL